MDSVYAHSQEIIGRADALARGLKRYFTGKSCKHGHVAERATVNHTCIECKAAIDAGFYARNSGQIKERVRSYAALNAEKVREGQSRRYRANPQKAAKRRDDWRIKNVDHFRQKARLYAANREARKASCSGSHSIGDLHEIKRLQKGRCAYCKRNLAAYDVDHIQPLARSGSNDRRNLQLTCPSCNRSKGAKDPIDFARERGMLL